MYDVRRGICRSLSIVRGSSMRRLPRKACRTLNAARDVFTFSRELICRRDGIEIRTRANVDLTRSDVVTVEYPLSGLHRSVCRKWLLCRYSKILTSIYLN